MGSGERLYISGFKRRGGQTTSYQLALSNPPSILMNAELDSLLLEGHQLSFQFFWQKHQRLIEIIFVEEFYLFVPHCFHIGYYLFIQYLYFICWFYFDSRHIFNRSLYIGQVNIKINMTISQVDFSSIKFQLKFCHQENGFFYGFFLNEWIIALVLFRLFTFFITIYFEIFRF